MVDAPCRATTFCEGKKSLLLGENLRERQQALDGGLSDRPALLAEGHALGDRPRQVDHPHRDHLVGHFVEPWNQAVGGHTEGGRHCGRQLPDELGDPPGRLLLGQGTERVLDQVRLIDAVDAALDADGAGHDTLTRHAEVGQPIEPLLFKRYGVGVRLWWAAVEHRLPLEPPSFSGVGSRSKVSVNRSIFSSMRASTASVR